MVSASLRTPPPSDVAFPMVGPTKAAPLCNHNESGRSAILRDDRTILRIRPNLPDDCGTIVNPMTLAGHVRGGTAQGIGSAIYEEYKYADDGQLLNANFADYILPSVNEVPPNVRVGHVVTPSPFTEYGIKGGGEGGRMGAPPAIASAIEGALKPFRAKADFLPLTPAKLRGLIRQATANQ
ncbi:molybdopterin-dependent oxidoreductase [Bradyrhizobium sp. UFLA01-814]|uniref:molybdopterin cofactor-binding domain-containing protein n=1 Tax=Bradyrhizobium sp. UFLA01-814 TaxID=3023480 RepID=UPI00398A9AE5